MAETIPAKTVVLTFDDAVKSHRTFVGPYLNELGFRATFLVTHRWMDDSAHFMTWEEIGELDRMGFEIGNHTWTHGDFSQPRGAARLAGELALVEYELARVKVAKPVSFAWPGNGFGPESVRVLEQRGIRFARRGMQPEVEYGRATRGPLFDPSRRHRLLIPTTADSYPNSTLEHFERVVAEAREGAAVVLQYHGVPDAAHPWVHTDPDLFRRSMELLKRNGYRVLALRDLERYLPPAPEDPVLRWRHRLPLDGRERLSAEVETSRASERYWRGVMAAHGYTEEEEEQVLGRRVAGKVEAARASVLPYPGGRHPRLGFFDGAVNPMRGTKASVFLPWDEAGYVVVDLPEAIFSQQGLIFLAHTHIPTVWDRRNIVVENLDWEIEAGGGLRSTWELPDKVRFGARIQPVQGGADMDLWIQNGSSQPLTRLRTQICVMLGRARGFSEQTRANKRLALPVAEARGEGGRRITVEWDRCGRVWENPPCPCIHSDPTLADCAPGETVQVEGQLRFREA